MDNRIPKNNSQKPLIEPKAIQALMIFAAQISKLLPYGCHIKIPVGKASKIISQHSKVEGMHFIHLSKPNMDLQIELKNG